MFRFTYDDAKLEVELSVLLVQSLNSHGHNVCESSSQSSRPGRKHVDPTRTVKSVGNRVDEGLQNHEDPDELVPDSDGLVVDACRWRTKGVSSADQVSSRSLVRTSEERHGVVSTHGGKEDGKICHCHTATSSGEGPRSV